MVGWLLRRRRLRMRLEDGVGGVGNKKKREGGSFTSGSLPHHNSRKAPRQTFSRMESHSKEKGGEGYDDDDDGEGEREKKERRYERTGRGRKPVKVCRR